MLNEPITKETAQPGVNFELTEEQKQFQEMAHDFAENEIRPVAMEYDDKEEMAWPVLENAHKLGLMSFAFP